APARPPRAGARARRAGRGARARRPRCPRAPPRRGRGQRGPNRRAPAWHATARARAACPETPWVPGTPPGRGPHTATGSDPTAPPKHSGREEYCARLAPRSFAEAVAIHPQREGEEGLEPPRRLELLGRAVLVRDRLVEPRRRVDELLEDRRVEPQALRRPRPDVLGGERGGEIGEPEHVAGVGPSLSPGRGPPPRPRPRPPPRPRAR